MTIFQDKLLTITYYDEAGEYVGIGLSCNDALIIKIRPAVLE